MMATAFDVLFRYTVNMLKLKRPRNWHTIKFSNAQFKARADCMIGTRNILKLMGYTNPILAEDGSQSGLSYPDPTKIDHDVIKIIGAELLTAKLEVKAAQEQGGFRYPLPTDNVQLDNPQPVRHPQFEPDYYSSVLQQPTQQQSAHFQRTPTTSSMASSELYKNYDSFQNTRSYTSQYSNPQTLIQHDSYQPPRSSYQSSNSNYEQVSVQPHYQARDQYNYHSDYQSNIQSSESTTNFDTSSSSSHPSSTEQQLSSSGGVSSRLAELRRRKEQIIKQAFGRDLQSSGDSNPGSLTAQAPYMHPPPTTQPSRVSPSTTTEFSHVSPSTTAEIQRSAASSQPTKPPPVKRRTKFLAVAPSNDEVKYPPSLPEETVPSVMHEGPVQQPQERKATFPRSRGPRVMVECDDCCFPNHERSQQCVECGNPRTERWRKVQMPSGGNTGEQSVVPATTVADVSNQPPPQERDPHHRTTTPPNTQSNNSQPNLVSSGQLDASGGAAAGASGTSSQPLRAYIPVVNYTAAEKEEMRKKAEREKMKAAQQEQGMNGGGAETVPLNSYVPRNDNYNWDEGKAGVRPTGNALFNAPNSTEPEDAQMYKSLGTQGNILIQDIKVGIE